MFQFESLCFIFCEVVFGSSSGFQFLEFHDNSFDEDFNICISFFLVTSCFCF